MKNETTSLIGILGIIIILVVIAFIVWWLHASGLDLLVGVIVGLVPSFLLFYQRRQDREENHKNWLLQNKEACAIELVDIFMSSALNVDNKSEQAKQDEMQRRLKILLPAIIVWGKPNLIEAWETMQTQTIGRDIGEITRQGERFLRAVRESLGHDDKGLRPGAVWAALIKPDEKEIIYKACKGETYD